MKAKIPIDLAREWDALCQNPKFRDLGYKVELQRNGKIIMSPANIRHGLVQSKVSNLLSRLRSEGQTATEAALLTRNGILVPDVVWGSSRWIAREAEASVAETSSELCVEIMSTSNTLAEMEEKRDAYFTAGCLEFILIDLKGFAAFWTPDGQTEKSHQAPGFPARIELTTK